MFSMGTVYAAVLLFVLLDELYAVPSASPPNPSKQHVFDQRPQPPGGQGREAAQEERQQIHSVTVSCHPDSLDIVIQADLFGVGASVRSSDVRLGVGNDERCKAAPSSREEYTITAGLLDCGTKQWMTRESLVYTNLLIYSPEPPAGGVVRMEEAVIPIECHYDRKYSLSSPALSPTWIPFVSTLSTVEKLNFKLKIMTPDWLYKRSSNVFFLGDDINIEASVGVGHHVGLRVFLSTCVATLTPDEHSLPRYVFIQDGCLLDSQLPNSRSQFMSRVWDDKLCLLLDAFRFQNEDRAEIYISCHMTAVPVHDAEATNKACTFINGRWRSADGNDYLCGYCQTQNKDNQIKDQPSSRFSPRGFRGPDIPERQWRSGLKTGQELDIEATVGPVLVLPNEKKTELKFDFPIYGSAWRSGLHQKIAPNEAVEPDGFINNKDDGLGDLIGNEVTEVIADKGLVPDEVPSPEEDPENVTETEGMSPPDVQNETSENATGDTDVFSVQLIPQISDLQENETTPDPTDIHTTPVFNTRTSSVNSTDSDLSEAKDPKRK